MLLLAVICVDDRLELALCFTLQALVHRIERTGVSLDELVKHIGISSEVSVLTEVTSYR